MVKLQLVEDSRPYPTGAKAGHVHLCRVAGNTDLIQQVPLRSSEMRFPLRELYITTFNLQLTLESVIKCGTLRDKVWHAWISISKLWLRIRKKSQQCPGQQTAEDHR